MTVIAWVAGVVFAFLPLLTLAGWRLVRERTEPLRSRAVLPMSRALGELPLWQLGRMHRKLYRRLMLTQDRRGPHSGEFGKGLRVEEESHYRGSEENLDSKPRLYLTFWPLRLISLRAEERALLRAARSFNARFPDGHVYLTRPAQRGVSPLATGKVCSIRHTLKLAHCWLLLPEGFPSRDRSVDSILDVSDEWLTDASGFRSVADVNEAADLWATAYALNLYYQINKSSQRDSKRHPDIGLIATEMSRLWHSELDSASGSIPAEQTLILIAHEIGEAVQVLDPNFSATIRHWLLSLTGPSGSPNETALAQARGVTEASTSIRLAYALYCTGGSERDWRPCLEHGLLLSDQYLSSPDLAWCVELIEILAKEHDVNWTPGYRRSTHARSGLGQRH
jgi:hypothetical protein